MINYKDPKYFDWLRELKAKGKVNLTISHDFDVFLYAVNVISKDEIKTDAYYQRLKRMQGIDGAENTRRLIEKLEELPKSEATSTALCEAFKFNHAFSSQDEASISANGLMSPQEAIDKGLIKRSTTPGAAVTSTVFGYGFSDSPF